MINLTNKQWWVLLSNLAVEFIWQIGYYATAINLIRFSDGIFNTYSYLENVLDVFNGVLYAVGSVNAIKITRLLGKDKFDEAYRYSKYSIWISLIIWLFYCVVSLIFIYPIALGVNDEYFELMFTVLPCYLAIHLFRFVAWNMGSYMLRLGGKNKPFVIIEIICTLILIAGCFVVQFLPASVPLAYFIILLPTLIFTPVYFIIFKSKRWMNNVTKDPNLISNKIKLIIFDFKDTLVWDMKDNNCELNLQWFNQHFSHLSQKQRNKLLKKYGCGLNGERLTSNIYKILFDLEGNVTPYLTFKDNVNTDKDCLFGKTISAEELQKFKGLGKIYIVSNYKHNDLLAAVKYNDFDESMFEQIISNDLSDPDNLDKGKIYLQIMKKNNLKPSQVLVIGNDFKNDLKSAKKLGMHYYLVKDGFTYDEILT